MSDNYPTKNDISYSKNIIIVNYNKKIKKFKIFFIIDFSFLKFIIKYEQNI